MKRTLLKLACAFTCASFLLVGGLGILQSTSSNPNGQASSPAPAYAAIDPLLKQEMELRPGEKVRVIIELKDQLKPFTEVAAARMLAQESQLGLVALLQDLKASDIKQHWIINAISTKLPAGSIYEIATHPDVVRIWLDKEISLIQPAIALPAEDYGDHIINAPAMWQQGFDGSGIRIAILDTGIDDTHPDLQGKVVAAKDLTDDGTVDDLHGHGTHCAGIAAGAYNPETGISGVAPGAYLINAKVLNREGEGYDSWLLAGIEWSIEQNADILSLSLGRPQEDGSGRDPVSRALTNAVAAGHVVITSAGNSGPGEATITAPATAYGIIAVAASDNLDAIAGFSSRGPTGDGRLGIDIAAPGVDIIAPNAFWEQEQDHISKSGTSMAAPHVAGAVALLLQASLIEAPRPTIVSRTEWGCPDGQDSPRWPPQSIPVTHIIIHHTTTTNDATDWDTEVLNIWHYHANIKGWGDIGYHYLIAPDGTIYEGRAGGLGTRGGHAINWNDRSVGIAFIGTFCEVEPTEAALRSAERLIAWISAQKGIDPLGKDDDEIHYICGHRDVAATLCPGQKLYDLLPKIRQNVADLLKLDSPLTPAEIERALKNSADNLGHDILEQGTGRLDIKDAYHGLTAGILVSPHEWFVGRVIAPSIHTKSFTVINNSEEDVFLEITKSNLLDSQGYLNALLMDVPASLLIPAGRTATFDAQLTVLDVARPGTATGSIRVGDITIPVSVSVMQYVDVTRVELWGTVDEDALAILPLPVFRGGDWIYYALDVQVGVDQLNVSLAWDSPLLNDLDLYLFNPEGELAVPPLGGHPERASVYFPAVGIWTVAINASVLAATPVGY
ncbi:S8 family serine peptidase, partial [Dehalococcoidia bacterium]|nr:S8 family serine peptidase [Dehalococcoidia bacterium]